MFDRAVRDADWVVNKVIWFAESSSARVASSAKAAKRIFKMLQYTKKIPQTQTAKQSQL